MSPHSGCVLAGPALALPETRTSHPTPNDVQQPASHQLCMPPTSVRTPSKHCSDQYHPCRTQSTLCLAHLSCAGHLVLQLPLEDGHQGSSPLRQLCLLLVQAGIPAGTAACLRSACYARAARFIAPQASYMLVSTDTLDPDDNSLAGVHLQVHGKGFWGAAAGAGAAAGDAPLLISDHTGCQPSDSCTASMPVVSCLCW